MLKLFLLFQLTLHYIGKVLFSWREKLLFPFDNRFTLTALDTDKDLVAETRLQSDSGVIWEIKN